jgi:hypothetical protein
MRSFFRSGQRIRLMVVVLGVVLALLATTTVVPCSAFVVGPFATGTLLLHRPQYQTTMVQRSSSVSSVSSILKHSAAASDNEDYDDDDEGVSVAWLDEEPDDDDDMEDEPATLTTATTKLGSRWDALNPKIKERIIQAGQERAMANKKKREPDSDKKRRTYSRNSLPPMFLQTFTHIFSLLSPVFE